MAGRRGWGGTPPTDDDDARARIVQAAMRCVDRSGPSEFTLAEVATELGVIRQTVYRYYPGVDQLFEAVGVYAVDSFVDDLQRHLLSHTEPADWAVEALATAVEWVPSRPYLTLLLDIGHAGTFAAGTTSSGAMDVGRRLFDGAPFDWKAAGFSRRQLDELIELLLRLLQSMVMNPPHPPRQGPALRRYLRRWLGPALARS